jgi:prolyl 4-hydroxylase
MILSIAPKIVFIENVLTPEQCNEIINSDLEFSPSIVKTLDNSIVNADVRSSHSSGDSKEQFSFLKNLAVDLAQQHSPSKNLKFVAEPISVQRYEIDQEYKQHYDFDDNNNRIATAIFYLNGDFEGGHTSFQQLSISIKPVTGSCLLFYYDTDIPKLKNLTSHGGNVVTCGTKYAATVWMKNHETSQRSK